MANTLKQLRLDTNLQVNYGTVMGTGRPHYQLTLLQAGRKSEQVSVNLTLGNKEAQSIVDQLAEQGVRATKPIPAIIETPQDLDPEVAELPPGPDESPTSDSPSQATMCMHCRYMEQPFCSIPGNRIVGLCTRWHLPRQYTLDDSCKHFKSRREAGARSDANQFIEQGVRVKEAPKPASDKEWVKSLRAEGKAEMEREAAQERLPHMTPYDPEVQCHGTIAGDATTLPKEDWIGLPEGWGSARLVLLAKLERIEKRLSDQADSSNGWREGASVRMDCVEATAKRIDAELKAHIATSLDYVSQGLLARRSAQLTDSIDEVRRNHTERMDRIDKIAQRIIQDMGTNKRRLEDWLAKGTEQLNAHKRGAKSVEERIDPIEGLVARHRNQTIDGQTEIRELTERIEVLEAKSDEVGGSIGFD